MRRSASVVVLVAAAIALAGCLSKPPAAPAQFADRQTDPVVLTGAATPTLANVPVGDIVAFRYTNGAWKQFPVQVDQRKTVELNTVYHQAANTTNPVNVLVYADPNTWVGAGSGVLVAAFPRYHPRWAWWMLRVPLLREFAVSNLVLVLRPR